MFTFCAHILYTYFVSFCLLKLCTRLMLTFVYSHIVHILCLLMCAPMFCRFVVPAHISCVYVFILPRGLRKKKNVFQFTHLYEFLRRSRSLLQHHQWHQLQVRNSPFLSCSPCCCVLIWLFFYGKCVLYFVSYIDDRHPRHTSLFSLAFYDSYLTQWHYFTYYCWIFFILIINVVVFVHLCTVTENRKFWNILKA